MTTLGDMKIRVIGLLGETQVTETEEGEAIEVVQGTTSAALLAEGVCAALRRISSRVWKPSVLDLAPDEETASFELPTDLINVEAVFDKKNKVFIPRMSLKATGAMPITNGNIWLTYPQGYITFINVIEPAYGATVYYAAHWALPEDDDDDLEAPVFANTAIALYATSYCLLAKASQSAEIRQYAQRIDAGQPTDIPAKDMSDFFIKRFELELNGLPMTERAIH